MVRSSFFGTIVDQHKKKFIFIVLSIGTLIMFLMAGVLYMTNSEQTLLSITNPMLWIFSLLILVGAIIGNMRGIALSTTVTLLVPKDRRANANGLIGTVSGIGFK